MYYDVPAGLVIGAALSRKSGRITDTDLTEVETSIRKNAPGYYVDFSRGSVYSEIEANSVCFAYENDQIVLRDFYMDKIGRIKSYFYDVLDIALQKAIDTALLQNGYE